MHHLGESRSLGQNNDATWITLPLAGLLCSAELERGRAGRGDGMILIAGTSADADRPYDLAIQLQRDAATKNHDSAVVLSVNAEELTARLRTLCQLLRLKVKCARRVGLLHGEAFFSAALITRRASSNFTAVIGSPSMGYASANDHWGLPIHWEFPFPLPCSVQTSPFLSVRKRWARVPPKARDALDTVGT